MVKIKKKHFWYLKINIYLCSVESSTNRPGGFPEPNTNSYEFGKKKQIK